MLKRVYHAKHAPVHDFDMFNIFIHLFTQQMFVIINDLSYNKKVSYMLMFSLKQRVKWEEVEVKNEEHH